MWERSVGEKNLAVLERIRDERKGRVDQSSVLYMSFKAWDPNKTLRETRSLPQLDVHAGDSSFSPSSSSSSRCISRRRLDARAARHRLPLFVLQTKALTTSGCSGFCCSCSARIHEFGHGLTCKHFGGDVHQMGFLLIYFTPAFYTDTTDILLFERGSQRQWVIFAGIWIELVVVWTLRRRLAFHSPGSDCNDIAYKMMLLSGIQGALLNLNPLIKADGYYALSQFLDIDNLREESFAFLRVWAEKYFLRRDIDLPPASRRQRRIFFIFGVTAIFYSVGLSSIVSSSQKMFSSANSASGDTLPPGVIYFFARKGIQHALPAVRAWLRRKAGGLYGLENDPRPASRRTRPGSPVVVPPVSSTVSTDLVLEPGKDAHLRAEVPGRSSRFTSTRGTQ